MSRLIPSTWISHLPPTFVKGADPAVNEDAGPQTIANWVTNISAGPPGDAGTSVAFLVSNDKTALFSAQPAISPTGTLAFTPAAPASLLLATVASSCTGQSSTICREGEENHAS